VFDVFVKLLHSFYSTIKVFSCTYRILFCGSAVFTGLRCLSQVGVKRLVSESFNCAYFKPDPRVFEVSSEKHDKLVKFVRKLFEDLRKGIKCEEEYELSLDSLKGRADIVCSDGKEVHIIEVKSTQVHRARMQDALQLMLYVYMYSKTQNTPLSSINAYLAYSYRESPYASAYIIRISDEAKKTLINVVSRLVESYSSIRSESFEGKGLYVISDLCDICVYDKCPFKALTGVIP